MVEACRRIGLGQPAKPVIGSAGDDQAICLVHDTLEQEGWDVEIADAQKVKGLAPLACKTDKIGSQVLGGLELPRWAARRRGRSRRERRERPLRDARLRDLSRRFQPPFSG